ncbi:MAG: polyprenyl synthetase family protein [Deltaproteobacteria bacterium]|nr:polyprenyl synthetase family protein [Deltaproteobacteria bacterium]MBW2070134.1 polyprenyl synthetase family protein [Deltaproteobacteria bacterium]
MTRIQKHLERIEEEIEKNLHSSVPLVALVSRYIIRSGGKRLRPLLMVLASQLLDPEQDEHYPLSIIFEYLHAATLLHDDVVDHAELRRGKAAANTVFGNAAVVLVGDFLLATSFALSVTSGNLKILQVLSDTTKMMAEGEILQLINSDNLEASEQDYREVITRKTAILIAAACQIGAILGRADLRQEESMHSFGLNLGIAFQLRDDVLDYAGSEEEVGKPIGNDLREGKITLPLIRALSRSNNNERQRLVELITADEIDDNVFLEVRRIIDRHQGIEYTSRMAAQHIAMAKDALLSFPSSPTRDLLEEIADYVVSRRV